MVKRYKAFLESKKEKKKREFGCAMLELDVDNWDEIIGDIDDKDLFTGPTFGKQTNPHVTLLYGLHEDVKKKDVKSIIDKYRDEKLDIKVSSIDLFENDEYDVVKFTVKSKLLKKINKDLRNLPHTNSFKVYKPHITIAYVKSGKGKKYIDNKVDLEISGYKFVLSDVNDKIVKV